MAANLRTSISQRDVKKGRVVGQFENLGLCEAIRPLNTSLKGGSYGKRKGVSEVLDSHAYEKSRFSDRDSCSASDKER
jgi:hypothetical protein